MSIYSKICKPLGLIIETKFMTLKPPNFNFFTAKDVDLKYLKMKLDTTTMPQCA